MIRYPRFIARSQFSSAVVVGMMLSGCAAGAVQHAPVPQHAAAAPETPQVTMAPVPNPPEHEAIRPSRSEPALHPAEQAAKHSTLKSSAPQHAAPVAPDPVRAAKLRAAGLEQMDRGAIRRAVALLQEASQLDPDNALIKRDLERAIRIGRAVGAKP